MLKIWTCLYIIFYLIRNNLTVAFICDGNSNPDVIKQVHLRVYKGNSTHNTYVESSLLNPEGITGAIVPNRENVLYIHGFLENSESETVQKIIRAYMDREDVNFILLDWGTVTIDINYAYVSNQVDGIGKAAAIALQKISDVIDLKKLHVIGHSLGAHVAGYIGRSLNVTIDRLTGLDPALPLFYPSTCHIKSSDAKAVVILHTDGGFYGTPVDTGTVDFYANKGISPQPGCPVIIGGETVRNPKAFLAHRCFEKFFTEDTKQPEEVYFGASTPLDLRGEYCFSTTASSPYSKNV